MKILCLCPPVDDDSLMDSAFACFQGQLHKDRQIAFWGENLQDFDALAMWDPLAIYLPWYLNSCRAALMGKEWTYPERRLVVDSGSVTDDETGDWRWGAAVFSRAAVEKCGGPDSLMDEGVPELLSLPGDPGVWSLRPAFVFRVDTNRKTATFQTMPNDNLDVAGMGVYQALQPAPASQRAVKGGCCGG